MKSNITDKIKQQWRVIPLIEMQNGFIASLIIFVKIRVTIMADEKISEETLILFLIIKSIIMT